MSRKSPFAPTLKGRWWRETNAKLLDFESWSTSWCLWTSLIFFLAKNHSIFDLIPDILKYLFSSSSCYSLLSLGVKSRKDLELAELYLKKSFENKTWQKNIMISTMKIDVLKIPMCIYVMPYPVSKGYEVEIRHIKNISYFKIQWRKMSNMMMQFP